MSPIATAPFLLQTDTNDFYSNTTKTSTTSTVARPESSIIFDGTTHSYITTYDNEVTSTRLRCTGNTTIHSAIFHEHKKSVLYQAYLLSTGLCTLAALPFIYMFCKFQKDADVEENSTDNVDEVSRNLPLKFKIFVLVLMSLFIGIDNGMEDTYFGFFTTFTVKQLKWSKQKGSYAASVYWAAYAFGRFAAIFIVPHFRPSMLLRIYVNLLIVSGIGMLLSTIYNSFWGIWIFTPIVGFSISVFFPLIFLLMEEDFIPVTGKVASLLMVSASLGSMINPIIIGYLMDNFSPMWFVYIPMGQTVALFVMTWASSYLSRKANKYVVSKEVSEDPEFVTKF